METTAESRNTRPLFPEDHAFVVQFQTSPVGTTERAGRIEHVTSGRALRFESGGELLAFVAVILAALDEPGRDDRQP